MYDMPLPGWPARAFGADWCEPDVKMKLEDPLPSLRSWVSPCRRSERWMTAGMRAGMGTNATATHLVSRAAGETVDDLVHGLHVHRALEDIVQLGGDCVVYEPAERGDGDTAGDWGERRVGRVHTQLSAPARRKRGRICVHEEPGTAPDTH